jgi:predicted permease
LYASSPHLATILGGEMVVGGTRKSVRRNILVIAQVAICTLVLVGMGLCQRNLYNLRHVDPGFSARNLVAVQVYPGSQGKSEAQVKNTYVQLRNTVAALPGVESVALARDLPLSLGLSQIPVELPDHSKKITIHQNIVDENYMGTFGIPVLEGRGFNSGDREGGQEVVMINRKMAETFWPRENALGKVLLVGDGEGHPPRQATVIGVTANGKYDSFDEPDDSVIYSALSQHYQAGFTVIARTQGDPRLWIEPLARVVREAGLVSVFRPLTYESWSNFTILLQRITAFIAEGLSGLGMLLAVIGLAGAISYSVSERKKELGIRMALGAGHGRLMSMVLRQTLVVAGAGIAIGIALGTVATALLRSQFFGIGVVEWTVLVSVSAGMLLVSLAVTYLSARPWISVNPMEAVRHA